MKREVRSLVLAAGLHALFLVLLGASVRTGPRPRPATPTKARELEVDLHTEAPLSDSASPLEPPAPEKGEAPARRIAPSPTLARVAPREPAPEESQRAEEDRPPSLDEPPPPVEEHAGEGSLVITTKPLDVLGAPGELRAEGTTASRREGEANAGGDKGAERAVRTALHERDRALGLGASGPVVAAAEEIARTSIAEVESHATLEAIADAEGNIVAVTVADASTDRAGWDTVAKALLASLRAKRVRVRVPKGSRGVAMAIAIDSKEALPSGAAPGLTVKLLDHDLHSGKNGRSNSVSILPLMKVPIILPKRGVPGGLETTIVTLPIPMPNIDAKFDVSDIGAHAARSVHAHAVSERDLDEAPSPFAADRGAWPDDEEAGPAVGAGTGSAGPRVRTQGRLEETREERAGGAAGVGSRKGPRARGRDRSREMALE
jgi:hypothetical protein